MKSSFFRPGPVTQEGQLASLHLSRDQSLPVTLSTTVHDAQDEGYAEGMVTNTKFGSFPHSTLIDVPWGSQVRASQVDTGSRGRQMTGKKRKAEAMSTNSPLPDGSSPFIKQATVAATGFLHVLPPTPENWTTSLPHRTQVVYTPDYSYILHRIRARPGSVLIEAGSGSGSFTHAAARAVYCGPMTPEITAVNGTQITKPVGKVFTYEFHPERHLKVLAEMSSHGLSDLVTATHRDVYKDGFMLSSSPSSPDERTISPSANTIFLDLPAPWEALPHLTRKQPTPLDPSNPVHICTFSPCIEQVQKTISTLRRLGWVEIEMVELQHRRLDIRREFTGLKYDGMRSVNVVPTDVAEAVDRLRETERRAREAHAAQADTNTDKKPLKPPPNQNGRSLDAAKVLMDEGRIVHRSEPDLKTHTSYLVFALLPQEWTDEDEQIARQGLQNSISQAPGAPKSQRQLKREAKLKKKHRAERRNTVDAEAQKQVAEDE